jgi:hypothetical protein
MLPPPVQLCITVTASLCIKAALCRQSTNFSSGTRNLRRYSIWWIFKETWTVVLVPSPWSVISVKWFSLQQYICTCNNWTADSNSYKKFKEWTRILHTHQTGMHISAVTQFVFIQSAAQKRKTVRTGFSWNRWGAGTEESLRKGWGHLKDVVFKK